MIRVRGRENEKMLIDDHPGCSLFIFKKLARVSYYIKLIMKPSLIIVNLSSSGLSPHIFTVSVVAHPLLEAGVISKVLIMLPITGPRTL